MLSLTIHRAAAQIGGNCVELRSGSERLILDAGLPLEAVESGAADLPATLDLSGYATVLISHPHLDHHGLIHQLPPNWPVWCGEPTASLIELSGHIGRRPLQRPLLTWRQRVPFTIGSFRITPRLTDHSAFDANMLEIEVDGRRILYTGDFRMHGRKAALVTRFMEQPPPNLDVLVMEGTTLGRSGGIPSEGDLEDRFVDLFTRCSGRVFVAWAGSNLDRTVTLARACLKTGRPLVIDLYTADVLRRLGVWSPALPQAGRPPTTTVITRRLATMYRRQGDGDLVELFAQTGISARKLSHVAKAVIMVRASLLPDYTANGLIPTDQDAWCWSQWGGYLSSTQGTDVAAWFGAAGCQAHHLHTSGHASPDDLKAFALAMQPKFLVPIHGENWDEPLPDFPSIQRLRDGCTWMVP